MNYNTSSTDELRKDSETSHGDSKGAGGARHEDCKMPAPRQIRTAVGHDGIIAFMENFTASTRADDAAPATQDFLKASAFLLRK
jgi:hypothetical protein